MKIVKIILKVLLMIVVVPVILYNLVIIAKSIIEPNRIPSVFGIKMLTVVTGSMEPTINIGDVVIIKEIDNYTVGDIISYKENNSVITHRIVQIEKDENDINIYTTKGDNNNVEDDIKLKEELIEGKVIKIIPKVGNIIMFLSKNLIWILILIILCAFIFDRKKEQM